MNKTVLAVIAVGSLATPLAAQPAGTVPSETAPSETAPSETVPSETVPSKTVPSETVPSKTAPSEIVSVEPVAIDEFLEQRVAEELAVDGTLLSRLGVTLDVEAVGNKLIVSLLDVATRRALASTKVDSVPADREAAVAVVTHVVANLTAQLAATASPAAAAVKAVLTEEREDRKARELAEYRYRQAAISFGNEIAVYSTGKTTGVGRKLVAYQGEERRRLEGREIYEVLGREDLAQRYTNRTIFGWAAGIGGITVMSIGTLVYFQNSFGSDCDYFDDPCEKRWKDEHRGYAQAGIALAAAGAVGSVIGWYYVFNPHPLGESELYDIAAEYNANLRKQYGLPVSERRRAHTHAPSLVLAPYALGDGGGLSVAGRF